MCVMSKCVKFYCFVGEPGEQVSTVALFLISSLVGVVGVVALVVVVVSALVMVVVVSALVVSLVVVSLVSVSLVLVVVMVALAGSFSASVRAVLRWLHAHTAPARKNEYPGVPWVKHETICASEYAFSALLVKEWTR